ncbi:MAG: TetR/AcrR family transcriptional regulator [Microthrixaceae bacterium]
MTRRSKEHRRIDYLDLGAQIVGESATTGSDPGLALAHVKLADVADRAGVTKGALYHVWPSQESFWHDLLEHLIATNQFFGADRVGAVQAEFADPVGPMPSLREFANALFDSVCTDPAFFARISLFSYLDDDRVRSELDQSFRESIEVVLPTIDQAISAMGRRMADCATLWDLAVAIGASLEGLCLQYRVAPGRIPDLTLDDGRWTLFAATAQALIQGYTMPIDEPGGD